MRLPLLAATATLMLVQPLLAAAQETPPSAAPATAAAEVPAPKAEAAPAPAATAPTDRQVLTPESLDLQEGQIDLEALTKEEKLPFFELEGYYRVRGNWLYRTDVDAEQPNVGKFIQNRLRLEPRFNINEHLVLKTEIDALDDAIWGANPGNVLSQSTEDRFPNVVLKRAWFDLTTPVGQLSAGRMPSNWGMGLLSNDGIGFKNTFGDAHEGSTFDRVQFGTKPLGVDSNWILGVIYDRLVSGEPAALVSPENTQGNVEEFVGVLYFNTDPLKLGVYQLYRFQNKTNTEINATDGYFKLDLGLLYAETEQVFLYGHTKAVPVLSQANFTVAKPRVEIDQYGYAAKVGLNVDPYGVEFEWGNATGDRNGFADYDKDANKPKPEVTNFKFNSDYNVGLIMFEYASAAFAERKLEAQVSGLETLKEEGIVNQATMDEALSVSELALTEGSVTNAFYINPKVRYSMLEGNLNFTAAYLTAWANASTVVKTADGKQKYDDYGHEFDLAVDYKYTKEFILGCQAGYLRTGNYFNAQDLITGEVQRPEDAALVQARFTVLF
jgi:hypothetical protein